MTSKFQPSAAVLKAVLAHAHACAPAECCGLVVADDTQPDGMRYRPARNIAERGDFKMHPDDRAEPEDRGWQILAVAHSHYLKSAEPTMADRVGCEFAEMPYLIVNCPTGAYTVTEPCGYKAPLLGRHYAYGIFDCATLVRDHYARQLDITLDVSGPRSGWWFGQDAQDVLRPALHANGFVEVDSDLRQDHDLLLFQFGRDAVPRHLAVFKHGAQGPVILHQLENQLSTAEPLTLSWQRRCVGTFRHRSLCT